MRRVVTVLLAAVAVSGTAAAAPATAVTAVGGCSYTAFRDRTPHEVAGGRHAYTGELDLAIVLLRPDGPALVSATVTCELRVDGVTHDAMTVRVAGAAAAVDVLDYSKIGGAVVEVCTVVAVDGEPSRTVCTTEPRHGVPAAVTETAYAVFEAVTVVEELVVDIVEPQSGVLLCALFKTAGLPGVMHTLMGVTELSMDADDCDLWSRGQRQIDFYPYED